MSELPKTGGDILSKVSPPSELPSFITATSAAAPLSNTDAATDASEPFIPTTFSAAIPPSKDTGSSSAATAAEAVKEEDVKTSSDFANMILNPEPVANALSPITQGGSALFGWMKGAVSNNTILQKVAEKAKNSVDTIVTTLDPQMKEYISLYGSDSGGDTEVIVASINDDKVRPIREAFQTIFGKATVIGLAAQPAGIAAQPVGFPAALKGAEQRINKVRVENPRVDDNLPIVAVENFVVELFPDEWFEAGMIVLFDYSNNILLKTVTQMTPIPSQVITSINADTPEDYEFKDTGFSITVGSVMAKNLNTHHTEWHKTFTSVNRTEMILNAAKTIATLYKQATIDKLTQSD